MGAPAGPAMYRLQKLLWDVRNNSGVAARYREDPESTLDAYGIDGPDRTDLLRRDVKALYDRGTNPYLLYFWSLQIGVDRTAYYAGLRQEDTR